MSLKIAILVAFLSTPLVVFPLHAQSNATRDSAGVHIVVNPARMSTPITLKLAAKPSLDLGGPKDKLEDEFNSQQGYLRAVRLSDGGIAVIDVVRVHYFDAKGRLVRVVGKDGAGPKEFRYITAICGTRGDTIVVTDSRNARLSILDRNGEFIRTVLRSEAGMPPFDGCFDDGTILLTVSASGADGKRALRMTRARIDGTVVNTFGQTAAAPFDMVAQSETTVIAAGQKMYVAESATGDIRVYSIDGKLTTIIRSADPLRKITSDEVEASLRASIPNNVSTGEANERMQQMRGRPHALTWPTFRRVHVDPRGNLWIQDYNTKYPADDIWTELDGNGRVIGRLAIPAPVKGSPRPEVINFGVNEVILRTWDEDEFTHLTMYPIQRVR